MLKLLKITGALLSLAASAGAVPFLQLDVLPGTYDPVTQTTVASANPFTLRALVDASTDYDKTRSYFISAAILPASNIANFGKFTFDGIEIGNGDYTYGVPPIDLDNGTKDPGDLPSHDVFPTSFVEFEFKLDLTKTLPAYNTQTGTASSGNLYYVDFDVDIAGLFNQPNSPYAIHFDLYNIVTEVTKTVKKTGKKTTLVTSYDIDVDQFAPFSHDAESGHGITIKNVPDNGGTVALLGFAFLGVVYLRSRSSNLAA